MVFTFRPAKYSDLELTYRLKKDGLKNNEIGYWTKRVSNSEIYIENLILGKRFQNSGFGTEIMKLLIKEAEKEKKPIGLRVLKENKRAKKFYENLGFEKISESENHYEMKKNWLQHSI